MAKKKKHKKGKKRKPQQFPPIGPPIVGKKVRIEQIRSTIGRPDDQKDALRGLGLRRIRHVVEREDTPAVRGQIKKVPHLVRIVEENVPIDEGNLDKSEEVEKYTSKKVEEDNSVSKP